MIDPRTIRKILFIDIETVSCEAGFEQLNDRMREQWIRKSAHFSESEDEDPSDLFFRRAGIYAEFGKIITIAAGYIYKDPNMGPQIRIKGLASHDEKILLTEFIDLLNGFHEDAILCAHNGKEFDFPYLCRRMLINELQLPDVLDLSGKKPWEISHLDTMAMWKFGDWKSYTSLDLLSTIFGIESSKDDIDGGMVNHLYYKEEALDRIREYCMHDVAVLIRIFLKLNGMADIEPENITFV